MIVEMFHLRGEKQASVEVTLTPETKEEEESLRNAKILHKNQIMVWWGDTLEIGNQEGGITCFDGLKISYRIPDNIFEKK